MKVRGKALWILFLLATLGIGAVMIGQMVRRRIERHWPDLTDVPAAELRDRQEDAWSPPATGCTPLNQSSCEGTVMGRVTVNTWRCDGRIYFQVLGPEPPGDHRQARDFVFCEAAYSLGVERKIEQYSADRARVLWQRHGQTTAHSAVSRSRYRIRHDTGSVTLIFWTRENEATEQVVFRYREDGQEGTKSFRVPAGVAPARR